MKVLVVGGGGREHALCWALSKDPQVERIYSAPGNPGVAEMATLVPLSTGDIQGLAEFAEREGVDLTVVGPEAPLVAGLVDEMQSRGLAAFGPTREGARIEGSKVWARGLCERHGIPAPRSREFRDAGAALEYLDSLDPPYVLKADGLAAGKGVAVTEDRASAERILEECLVQGVFGDAGGQVLVEEYLEGVEVSALALTDGHHVLPLELAQDYKRALDGDEGPNTGGMGCFSPLPFVDPSSEGRAIRDILESTVAALEQEGIAYRGVLYAGLMLTSEGPKVLEFNCRFGDPETQVILPRLTCDLGEVLLACAHADISNRGLTWSPRACVAVVLVSRGYPGAVEGGKPIEGLEKAGRKEDVLVFHAGTTTRGDRVVTAGGRVLAVTALGADLEQARRRAYDACSLIEFEGMSYRRDIAERIAVRAT